MRHKSNRERVHCRVCGRRVRSAVGEVCSRAVCHRKYLALAEKYGW